MIELDAAQLRNLADVLAGLERVERDTGVAINGHRGTVEVTVNGGVNPQADQVLEVARVEASNGPRYVLRVGD